jgi:hypothetical protein
MNRGRLDGPPPLLLRSHPATHLIAAPTILLTEGVEGSGRIFLEEATVNIHVDILRVHFSFHSVHSSMYCIYHVSRVPRVIAYVRFITD